MNTALVTGGSAGLGLALTRRLATDGWHVVTDGRDAERLRRATASVHAEGPEPGRVTSVPGDVTDAGHRQRLVEVVVSTGRLDLVVNNASSLGPSPLRPLMDLDAEDFERMWLVNVAAPLALTQAVLPLLCRSGGVLLSVSSDAAVEHYEGWGGYGASKAALDHLTLTIGAENPEIVAYAVDPGDMRTAMHQAAFPGEDISDRPLPASVVPHLVGLLQVRPGTGRYRAADFPASTVQDQDLATNGRAAGTVAGATS